jgi:hypothetical protein
MLYKICIFLLAIRPLLVVVTELGPQRSGDVHRTCEKDRPNWRSLMQDHLLWSRWLSYTLRTFSSFAKFLIHNLLINLQSPTGGGYQLEQNGGYSRIDVLTLYSLVWDFLLSQINIYGAHQHEVAWNYIVNNLKHIISPSILTSIVGYQKYLHLTTFSNICVILSMILYL